MNTTVTGTTPNLSNLYTAKDNPLPGTTITTGDQYQDGTALTTTQSHIPVTSITLPVGTLHGGYFINIVWETDIPTGSEILEAIIYEDDNQITTTDQLIILHNNTTGTIDEASIAAIFDRNKEYRLELKTKDITGYYLTIDTLQLGHAVLSRGGNGDKVLAVEDQGTASIPSSGTAETHVDVTFNYPFTETPFPKGLVTTAQNFYAAVPVADLTSTGMAIYIRTLTGGAVGSGQTVNWVVDGSVALPCVLQ